jgi:hypothetical protein
MKNRHIILILILNLIIELILKSSNITNLLLIDLLVLSVTVMIQKNSSFLMLTLFLVFSIITEFFGSRPIGIIGLSWFLGLLSLKIIGNFIHIFNLNRKNFFSLLLLYLLFISYRLIINSVLGDTTIIEFPAIIINIIILAILNWVINKFYNNKYVLER